MVSIAERAPTSGTPDQAECLRRQSILNAASALLEEEGLEGLTIRAMLKRTGLARRAFYERFAGKDDLVLSVFEETLRAAATFFEEAIAEQPDPLSQIHAIISGLVLGGQQMENPGIGVRMVSAIVREHMRLAQTHPAELERALAPLLGVLADRISAGIRQGQLRDSDPALQATLIYNLIASTIHTELLREEDARPDGEGRQRLADAIWEFCRRAIVA